MKMIINLKQFAMKKSTIFKIVLSLSLAIMVTGAFSQVVTPTVTLDLISNVDNYVEVAAADDDGNPTTSFSTGNNNVTISGTFNLIELVGAATGDARYVSTSNAITHVVPLVVTPDGNLNNGAFDPATGDFTFANLNSGWSWTAIAGATGASYSFIADGDLPAAWNALTNRDNTNFNERYVTAGGSTGNATVAVAEQSMDGAGNVLCTDGTTETIVLEHFAQPQCTESAGTDVSDCEEDLEDVLTTDLILALVGTPPFYIGYLIEEQTLQSGSWTNVGYTYRTVLTGSTDGITSSDGEADDPIIGTLNGAGVTWTYNMPLVVDTDGSTAAPDGNNDTRFEVAASGLPTRYIIEAKFVNDLTSRKSDRKAGTIGDWSNVGELASHVLYTAAGGDLTLTVYPTPVTGNIYALPN
jgi:hypothetical protein